LIDFFSISSNVLFAGKDMQILTFPKMMFGYKKISLLENISAIPYIFDRTSAQPVTRQLNNISSSNYAKQLYNCPLPEEPL
jgi:hypothetical protein